MSKVDIYLPTYRPDKNHLTTAIDSILAQTESDWTLWISNQVSDVAIEPIVQPYLHDHRIELVHNHDHPGIGANWNYCLQFGDAPVIQYMFDDDIWAPDYLTTGLQILKENTNVGIVSLGHEYQFDDDVPGKNAYQEVTDTLAEHIHSGQHDGTELLLWWFKQGLHPNIIGEPMFVMLRRQTIDTVGRFREDMAQNLDSEYWARCLAKTNWYYRPGQYGRFRVHAAAASATNFSSNKGMFDRLRVLQTILPLLPKEQQKEARKSLNEQMGYMAEKFVRRFYPRSRIQYRGNQALPVFLLTNWRDVLRAGWAFAKRR